MIGLLTLTPPQIPTISLKKKTLFTEVSRILLTEKLIRVKFFVPFPTYEITMNPDIQRTIEQLSLLWETRSLFSPINFFNLFETNTFGINVNWMLHRNEPGIFLAQQDLALIRKEVALF